MRRRKYKVNQNKMGLFISAIFFICVVLFSGSFVVKAVEERPQAVFTLPIEAPKSASWNLKLVNSWNPLEAGYNIELKTIGNNQAVDIRIFDELTHMINDAQAQGYSLLICSSYRDIDKQRELFERKVRQYRNSGFATEEARSLAKTWVAEPGTSEHHLGLAVDIVPMENQRLDESQCDEPAQKWLHTHCSEYGFIVRYPQGKNHLTGVSFEPWHYRYVGRDAAREIMQRGECLEEYLKR